MMQSSLLFSRGRPRQKSRQSWIALAAMLFVFVAACRTVAPTPPFDASDPQRQADALRVHLEEHPEDTRAWRDLAHLQWLYLEQTLESIAVLDRLAADGDVVSRLSRMIIAHSYNEPEVLQTLAFASIKDLAASSADDPLYRLRVAEAEHAARWMADMHGARANDDERFVELFEGLTVNRLPFAVVQPLLSLRAAIARRTHEEYRSLYEAQGCMQRWTAGAVEGSRGAVELQRAKVGNIEPAPKAAVVSLACVMRVWNPEPSPGIRRMATYLEAPGGPLVLNLGAQEPTRFYLDGSLVHATDGIDRYAPHRASFDLVLSPGWHRLEVHTTIPADSAWVMARAWVPGQGPVSTDPQAPSALAEPWTGTAGRHLSPFPDPLPGIEGPIYGPVRDYLAVDDALAEGDSDRAERRLRSLQRAEQFAQGALQHARVERGDPSRGRTVSLSREVEALQRALALDPKLDGVRLRLLEVQRDRGEEAEVEKSLKDRSEGHLSGIDGELFRFSVFLAQGNEHLAEQALTRAIALNPKSCDVLMARRSLARQRMDVRAEDDVAEALRRCSGSLALRARLAESRGRWDEAAALWHEALDRNADDLAAHERLARVEALRGDIKKAQVQLREGMQFNPYRVGSHLALADLAASGGDREAARSELRAALTKIPQSNALWHAAADLGIDDDLMHWREDGTAVLADYRASGATYEGVGEVLILDRSVARVYPNGGQRQLVHIIAHLLSKESLDDYGELDIPGGAELLSLRSIKPDGRTLEPEIVPGKEGVSLRHLEIGDVVEYEFIVENSPAGAVPGYVDVSTFRFQSPDVPYHRSELFVVHPPALEIRHDDRNAPPVDRPTTETVNGRSLVVHHWRAEEVPRLGVEPGARHWLDELPNVHVYTDLDLPRYLDGLAAQVRGTQRRNPELRRQVHEIIRGQRTPLDKVRALWTWVVENVEDAGDLSVPASATLAGRTGSRLMLLRAMLREADIDAELWLARDGYGPAPIPGGHPLIDQYEAGMLAVRLPDAKEPLMVMTASKVIPLGYLTPSFRKTQALRVQLEPHEGASGLVTLPDAPVGLRDVRRYDIDFSLTAGGSGTVEGTITLQGMEAILWRQALRQIDRDRIEEIFQQAELGWLPGGSLTSLEIVDEEHLERPLELRFAASSPTIGIVQDGELVLRATPMPLNPAAMFASLPERTTGLSVSYAPQLEAELRYSVTGARFAEVPQPASIRSDYGSFERAVEGGAGGNTVEVVVHSSIKTGVLGPLEYPGLAQYARNVEHSVQQVLRAR